MANEDIRISLALSIDKAQADQAERSILNLEQRLKSLTSTMTHAITHGMGYNWRDISEPFDRANNAIVKLAANAQNLIRIKSYGERIAESVSGLSNQSGLISARPISEILPGTFNEQALIATRTLSERMSDVVASAQQLVHINPDIAFIEQLNKELLQSVGLSQKLGQALVDAAQRSPMSGTRRASVDAGHRRGLGFVLDDDAEKAFLRLSQIGRSLSPATDELAASLARVTREGMSAAEAVEALVRANNKIQLSDRGLFGKDSIGASMLQQSIAQQQAEGFAQELENIQRREKSLFGVLSVEKQITAEAKKRSGFGGAGAGFVMPTFIQFSAMPFGSLANNVGLPGLSQAIFTVGDLAGSVDNFIVIKDQINIMSDRLRGLQGPIGFFSRMVSNMVSPLGATAAGFGAILGGLIPIIAAFGLLSLAVKHFQDAAKEAALELENAIKGIEQATTAQAEGKTTSEVREDIAAATRRRDIEQQQLSKIQTIISVYDSLNAVVTDAQTKIIAAGSDISQLTQAELELSGARQRLADFSGTAVGEFNQQFGGSFTSVDQLRQYMQGTDEGKGLQARVDAANAAIQSLENLVNSGALAANDLEVNIARQRELDDQRTRGILEAEMFLSDATLAQVQERIRAYEVESRALIQNYQNMSEAEKKEIAERLSYMSGALSVYGDGSAGERAMQIGNAFVDMLNNFTKGVEEFVATTARALEQQNLLARQYIDTQLFMRNATREEINQRIQDNLSEIEILKQARSRANGEELENINERIMLLEQESQQLNATGNAPTAQDWRNAAEAVREYRQQIEQLTQDYIRQSERINQEREISRLRELEDFLLGRSRAMEDEALRIEREAQDLDRQEKRRNKDSARRLEDFMRRIREIMEDAAEAMAEAVGERDARAWVKAKRDRDKAIKRETEQYELAEKRRQEDLQDEKEYQDESRRQRESDYQRRLAREDEDRRIRLQRLSEDIARQDQIRLQDYQYRISQLQSELMKQQNVWAATATTATFYQQYIANGFISMLQYIASATASAKSGPAAKGATTGVEKALGATGSSPVIVLDIRGATTSYIRANSNEEARAVFDQVLRAYGA